MVARGAGAAWPGLLACRQWDPLGLARRLPSLGVGAWCCAPLLPWRMQCPVCVCAALAAGSGGSGRYLVLCLSRFPPPCPACSALRVAGRPVRVSLILARWYAIPRGLCVPRARSGCPSGSPRVSPSCVCARAPAASAPPPWVVWRAHLARSRRWALVGPFHVVRALPRVLPRSLAPSGVLGGWLVPPYLAWGCGGGGGASLGGVPSTVARGVWGQALPLPRLPAHWAGCRGPRSTCCGRGRAGVGALLCLLGRHALWGLRAAGRVRGVRVPGGGGGGCVRRTPLFVRPGGASRAGGRSASFRPSAFPGQATKRVSLALCCPWGAWPPTSLRFVLTGLLRLQPVRRPGALARARLFFAAPLGAGGWGGGAGRAPAPLSGRGGTISLASGGGCRGPRGLRAGGGAGGGVSRRGPPAPLLGSGLRYSILAPVVSSARSLPACACSRGPSAAPGWGGVRGGPWTASPGALADLNPPPALPEWAVVTGGSCGARPPYCSAVRVAPAR